MQDFFCITRWSPARHVVQRRPVEADVYARHGREPFGRNAQAEGRPLYVNPVNVVNILTKVSRRCQREALSEACLPQTGAL